MDPYQLISKYILGKADKEEKAMLESWKKESEDNLDMFRQTIKLSEASENLRDYQEVNKSKAWHNIEKRTLPDTKVFGINIWMKVAAVFIILVASVFVFSYLNGDTQNREKSYSYENVSKVSLRDGSVVDLDKESIINEKSLRTVALQGRAYFVISPDKSKPFTVELFHGILTVTGTEFNIVTNAGITQIYITEGNVKHQYNGVEYILNAGDVLTITKDEITQSSNPSEKILSWKSGKLIFTNASLHHVLEGIAVYYNVELVFQNDQKDDKCMINTTFSNENIDQVLKELSIVAGLKYEFTKNKILVRSYKC